MLESTPWSSVWQLATWSPISACNELAYVLSVNVVETLWSHSSVAVWFEFLLEAATTLVLIILLPLRRLCTYTQPEKLNSSSSSPPPSSSFFFFFPKSTGFQTSIDYFPKASTGERLSRWSTSIRHAFSFTRRLHLVDNTWETCLKCVKISLPVLLV